MTAVFYYSCTRGEHIHRCARRLLSIFFHNFAILWQALKYLRNVSIEFIVIPDTFLEIYDEIIYRNDSLMCKTPVSSHVSDDNRIVDDIDCCCDKV